MSKFIVVDHTQAMLLPPDLREWVPEDDLVNFVIEAARRVPVTKFKVNVRGTGSAQHHPHTLLALLVYCYTQGVFGSRRIERATYRDVAVRYLTGDTHPDHDTICKFRRENETALAEAFLQVLLLAKELKLLKVGTVSVDGTKIDANASKHRSVRYDRARALREQLQNEIEGLLKQANMADQRESEDGARLPDELARREKLKAQMDAATARLEAEAKAQAASQRQAHATKEAARERRSGRRKGPKIKPLSEAPEPEAQTNLTDPDSKLMRKNKQSEYRQAYNAQLAVDADGSQLILGARISTCASDRHELLADLEAIPAQVGKPACVLADNGFATGEEVLEVQARGIDALVAIGRSERRLHDLRPEPERQKAPPEIREPWMLAMQDRLREEGNRRRYRLRQQTVEPAIGIIKSILGFRQFLLRGVDKVRTEWMLVALAYKRKAAPPAAMRHVIGQSAFKHPKMPAPTSARRES